MIIEWLTDVGVSMLIAMAGWFPDFVIPPEVEDARGVMLSLLATYHGLGVWVPWAVLGICITAVTGVYATGVVIKLIRVVVAHIPQVGGGGG